MHKDTFLEMFPDAEWLENYQGRERWSSMEGEGHLYESMWFCKECGEEAHWLDECECDAEDDDDEPRTRQGNI